VPTINQEGVFPVPREKIWRLIELHVDDNVIRKIHPSVLSSKQLNKEGNSWVFERKMRSYGGVFNLKWRFELMPMDCFRAEVISSTGGVAAGSSVENRFIDAGDFTKVSTKAEMSLIGIPSFLQSWFLSRVFRQADKEDLRYVENSIP
jgi:hypothetical protein